MAEGYVNNYNLMDGYKLKIIQAELTFTNGEASLVHNLGTTDYYPMAFPKSGLIPVNYLYANANSVTIAIQWIDNNVLKTYSGTITIPIFIFYK